MRCVVCESYCVVVYTEDESVEECCDVMSYVLWCSKWCDVESCKSMNKG
jgi:hypothetical protein